MVLRCRWDIDLYIDAIGGDIRLDVFGDIENAETLVAALQARRTGPDRPPTCPAVRMESGGPRFSDDRSRAKSGGHGFHGIRHRRHLRGSE